MLIIIDDLEKLLGSIFLFKLTSLATHCIAKLVSYNACNLCITIHNVLLYNIQYLIAEVTEIAID